MKGSKKMNLQKPQEPRSTVEIQKEYSDLCSKVGHTQYQVKVLEANLSQLFDRIVALDKESRARQELDAKAKEEEKQEGAV